MTKATADLILIVIMVVPFATAGLYVAGMALLARRAEKTEARRWRLVDGLPNHRQCPCAECRTWRKREF